jgi:hypothetical protein
LSTAAPLLLGLIDWPLVMLLPLLLPLDELPDDPYALLPVEPVPVLPVPPTEDDEPVLPLVPVPAAPVVPLVVPVPTPVAPVVPPVRSLTAPDCAKAMPEAAASAVAAMANLMRVFMKSSLSKV